MYHQIDKDVHLYRSSQEVQGGGSRNCMDWILDSHAQGAKHVIIYLPHAKAPLVNQVKRYADKIVGRLHGSIGVHVVGNNAALKALTKRLDVQL